MKDASAGVTVRVRKEFVSVVIGVPDEGCILPSDAAACVGDL
jgi:hypothetical protein